LAPLSASAQLGNAGFMAPDTRFTSPGVPAPNQTNNTDRLFARLATEGGLAEVALGELASGKAQTPAVSEFAQRMVSDHGNGNERLAGIANKSSIPLPEELNPEHRAQREQLQALDGAAFDLAYMQGQVAEHQKTTQLLIWEIGSGQDAELQQFAAETLPTVLEHLRVARETVAQLQQDAAAGGARD